MNQLTWKKVLTINALILGIAVISVSYRLSQTPTSTTTKASLPAPTPTTVPQYPSNPPLITSLIPDWGKPGDDIRIQGQHFGAAPWESQIIIDGLVVPPDHIITWQDTYIDFTIPSELDYTTATLTLTVNSQTTSTTLRALP